MGTISINPDADGDLHSAALHNNKFQTILNEINGNLDANNLANPNSFLTLTSFAGRSAVVIAGGSSAGTYYPLLGWTPTATVTDEATQASLTAPMLPTGVVDGCNIVVDSQFRNTTGGSMTLHTATAAYQTNAALGNASVILRVQQNSTVGNGWTDMATMTFNPSAAASNVSTSSFASLPVPVLASNNFFRVLVQNDSAVALGASPNALPYLSFTATFKVAHTN